MHVTSTTVVNSCPYRPIIRSKYVSLHFMTSATGENSCPLISDRPINTTIYVSLQFLTATTAERFFRIDRSQEHLHYITDISSEDLYILDPDLQSMHLTGGIEEETSEAIQEHIVCKEDNFQPTKENELVFRFSLPVTPPKSPG